VEKDYKESQLADALGELDQIQVNILFCNPLSCVADPDPEPDPDP
jgi:hypothetical protein